MNKHKDFILTPIITILEDAISSSRGLSIGISTYPVWDYILQSTFLRMTGFQEQKMKCIIWELATNDYEYRYDKFRNGLGECSNYKDKEAIFNEIIKIIRKKSDIYTFSPIKRKKLLISSYRELHNVMYNSQLYVYGKRKYEEFINICREIKSYECIFNSQDFSQFREYNAKKGEFKKNNKGDFIFITHTKSIKRLKTIYEDHLYRNRNRIAHNLLSYQKNLPKLDVLRGENYKYENYFVWFAILILIDKIFIELYNEYLKSLD